MTVIVYYDIHIVNCFRVLPAQSYCENLSQYFLLSKLAFDSNGQLSSTGFSIGDYPRHEGEIVTLSLVLVAAERFVLSGCFQSELTL